MNETQNKQILCDALKVVFKELRKKAGLSQYELANRTKVDRAFISLIEVGQAQFSVLTLMKISKGLDVKPSFFIKKLEEELGDSLNFDEE